MATGGGGLVTGGELGREGAADCAGAADLTESSASSRGLATLLVSEAKGKGTAEATLTSSTEARISQHHLRSGVVPWFLLEVSILRKYPRFGRIYHSSHPLGAAAWSRL